MRFVVLPLSFVNGLCGLDQEGRSHFSLHPARVLHAVFVQSFEFFTYIDTDCRLHGGLEIFGGLGSVALGPACAPRWSGHDWLSVIKGLFGIVGIAFAASVLPHLRILIK